MDPGRSPSPHRGSGPHNHGGRAGGGEVGPDIEDILSEHLSVADALVASTVDTTGEPELIAWVVLERDVAPTLDIASDLRRYVLESLGGLARPSRIGFAEGFPEQFPRRSLRLVLGTVSQTTTGQLPQLLLTELQKALEQHHG